MAVTVLAYSGGLDTSVLLKWLVERGDEVHALYINIGQPSENMAAILKKAINCGAKAAKAIDCREELCRDFAFPALLFDARYEVEYLLGTSIARPCIAKACIDYARKVKATVFCHGATGKGNDQCRFELTANALAPEITVYAPWRDPQFRKTFPGRKEMIAYCAAHKIPVKASLKKPYSSDENCLHISYEAGLLEDPAVEGAPIIDFSMTISPEKAPNKYQKVAIEFADGVPVKVNGKKLSPFGVVTTLNALGGRNGVGRVDMVENRFVGMKSRGVYEAPGMTILYAAHRALEQLTVDRDLIHLRNRLMPEVAEMIYYGFWYCRKMDALFAFNKEAQKKVSGEIVVSLYKGNVNIVSRKSPFSLYSESIATMEAGGSYNQDDATGFLRIQGLPLRVQKRVFPRK
ncbi:MAG TPA: argininosuccinate synthase [Planctomycetota bacterium]|nr:argininosuccinate synthase [Planctomycetota bacterium]